MVLWQPHPDTYTPFLARFSQLSFPRLGGDQGHVGGHSGVQIDGGKLGGDRGLGHGVVVLRDGATVAITYTQYDLLGSV